MPKCDLGEKYRTSPQCSVVFSKKSVPTPCTLTFISLGGGGGGGKGHYCLAPLCNHLLQLHARQLHSDEGYADDYMSTSTHPSSAWVELFTRLGHSPVHTGASVDRESLDGILCSVGSRALGLCAGAGIAAWSGRDFDG